MKFPPQWASHKNSSLYHTVPTTSNEEYGSKEALLDEANSTHSPTWNESTWLSREKKSTKCLYGSLLLNAALATGLAVASIPRLQQYLHDPFNNLLIKQVSMPCKSCRQCSMPID
jgi:hypothetical protein